MAMAPKKSTVKKTAPAKGQNFGAGYSESDGGILKGKKAPAKKMGPKGKK